MKDYSLEDLADIRKILNEKYFKNTNYFCQEVSIKESIIRSIKTKHGNYITSCKLITASKENYLNDIFHFVSKISVEYVALQLAHKIWAKIYGSKKSQLYKNL